jgi:hypothetical protein
MVARQGDVSNPVQPAPSAVGKIDRADAIRQWLLRLEASRYAPASAGSASLTALRREFRQLPWPK